MRINKIYRHLVTGELKVHRHLLTGELKVRSYLDKLDNLVRRTPYTNCCRVMELITSSLTLPLVGAATALVLYCLLNKKENRYPPGPFVFPVLGNLPQLALARSITKFAEYYKQKHGNVS